MTDTLDRQIGKRLRAARKKAGLTQQALADKAGLGDKITIVRYEQGKGIQIPTMKKIESALDLPHGALLDSSFEVDMAKAKDYSQDEMREVPAFDSIRMVAGNAQFMQEPGRVEKTIQYRTKRPNLVAIPIEDNSYSMNRVAVPGQYIIIDLDAIDPDELDGKLIIACIDGACTFKRWKRNPDRLEPESTHHDYDVTFIREYENFRIIGKVIDVVGNKRVFE